MITRDNRIIRLWNIYEEIIFEGREEISDGQREDTGQEKMTEIEESVGPFQVETKRKLTVKELLWSESSHRQCFSISTDKSLVADKATQQGNVKVNVSI